MYSIILIFFLIFNVTFSQELPLEKFYKSLNNYYVDVECYTNNPAERYLFKKHIFAENRSELNEKIVDHCKSWSYVNIEKLDILEVNNKPSREAIEKAIGKERTSYFSWPPREIRGEIYKFYENYQN
jgi:hypothetical protein